MRTCQGKRTTKRVDHLEVVCCVSCEKPLPENIKRLNECPKTRVDVPQVHPGTLLSKNSICI
jgi:hypothetical protein